MTAGAVAPALRERVEGLARRIPKVELHVHLEGTMTAERLRQLARKHDVQLDAVALQTLGADSALDSFTPFIASFVERMRVLRDPDDWCTILDDLLAAQYGHNVKYTEAFVTFYGALRGDYVLRDVLAAMAEVEREWHARGCALRLVMDAPRPFGPELAMQLFRLAAADETGLLIGVGIGGDELVGPAEQFAPAYAFATEAGMLLTAHAGEHGGRDSVQAAVDVLGVHRIGHGVAAARHPDLLHHMRERGVAIDVCPGSNRATGAWDPRTGPHPVRTFVESGVRIDVGSDDPAIFGNDVSGEWSQLMLRDGFTPHECFELTLAALDVAFLDDAHRARLRAHFEAELEDLREEAAALEEALHAAHEA
jgi:adenosine deaminase